MNKKPICHGSNIINMCPGSLHAAINRYGGLIDQSCLLLLAEEWEMETSIKKKPQMRIMVFSGFESPHNVHQFCYGFDPGNSARYRQTTISELLCLGAHDQKIGLCGGDVDWTYCLGSASITNSLACGMIDPTCYYPGLESMDGKRQMIARSITCSFDDKRIALVKL